VVVTDRDRDARLDDELRRLAARRSRNGRNYMPLAPATPLRPARHAPLTPARR